MVVRSINLKGFFWGKSKLDKKFGLIGQVILIFIFAFNIILTGCTNKSKVMNYKGESLNWIASYKMVGNDKKHKSYFTLQYKANDIGKIKEVKYLIDGPKGEGDIVSIPKSKVVTNKLKFNNGLPYNNDRNIILELQWSDDTELLLLTPVEEQEQ